MMIFFLLFQGSSLSTAPMTTSVHQKSQEILNFLKRKKPQQYLSTTEIENAFSHQPKEELHSTLRTLMSQGHISQQYSFGTETWGLNGSSCALPSFKSTKSTTRSPPLWNPNLKKSKSNPILQQTNSLQVIFASIKFIWVSELFYYEPSCINYVIVLII